MKIALGQLNMGFEKKEQAMHLCCQLLNDAQKKKADLIVFPEMTLTGFSLQPQIYGETKANSATISFFKEEAKKHNIAICFGLPIYENGIATNHCIILDAHGTELADYTKIHPFSYGEEAKHYIGGNTLSFCEIKGIPISPLICYDLRFPELSQILSEKSKLITIIANWPTSRREHWISLLKARAIENQCFIIGVNRTGNGGGLSYSGDSMIISPLGECIVHLSQEETLAVVEIEPSEVDTCRTVFPVKADRKPELYYTLWKNNQIK